MKKKISKTQRVINHLEKYGNITSLQAFQKWNATRLSAIIHTLRHKRDFDIVNEPYRSKDGTPFVKYVFRGINQ